MISINIASVETSLIPLFGGVMYRDPARMQACPIDGHHALDNDFDFSAQTFEEWLDAYKDMVPMTCWLGDQNNDDILKSQIADMAQIKNTLAEMAPEEAKDCAIWMCADIPKATLEQTFQQMRYAALEA